MPQILVGLLCLQQSFVRVSRLHVEKKGLCTVRRAHGLHWAGRETPFDKESKGVFSPWVFVEIGAEFSGRNFLI